MLFTGARREEICQLSTERIRKENDIDVIDIDTLSDNSALKTSNSYRTTPIHKSLLKLGFLDFVAHTKKQKNANDMLFPELAINARDHYVSWVQFSRGASHQNYAAI